MKIKGYKTVYKYQNNSVYVLKSCIQSIPLNMVLLRGIISMEIPTCLTPNREDSYDENSPNTWANHNSRFAFRDDDGKVVRLSGMIMAYKYSPLLDFLTEKYIPQGNSELDDLIRYSCDKGMKTEEIKSEIEEHIGILKNEFDYDPVNWQYGNRMGCIHLSTDKEDSEHALIKMKNGDFFFYTNQKAFVLTFDEIVEISGHLVPVRRFLVTEHYKQHHRQKHFNKKTRPRLFWDGRTMKYVNSMDDVPLPFLDKLEKYGTSFSADTFINIPFPELKILYIARIPARKEVRSQINYLELPDEKWKNYLQKPLFLFDTRCPIIIPDNTPVIDDAAVAAQLLSMLSNHMIYVPEKFAYEQENILSVFPEKQYYVAAMTL